MQPNITHTYDLPGGVVASALSGDFVTVTKNPLPIDAPERRRLPLLLRHAWFGLNRAFRRRIAHLKLTPDQFTVLRTLGENQNITQAGLTRLINSDPNTIAALLDRMERIGLLERKTHEGDRRANVPRLTNAGRKTYEKARSIAVQMQTEILETLPVARREVFLTDLEAIATACREAAAQK